MAAAAVHPTGTPADQPGRSHSLRLELTVICLRGLPPGRKAADNGDFGFLPQVIAGSFAANVDWIAILGFLLPPQIGLFFVLLKPQIGLGVAIFWFVEAWRRGKIKEVVKVFAPVTLAYILSFIIFGFWPARYLELPESVWNTSMFPYSIAIGLVLLGLAIKNRSLNYSITASPLLSPYVAWYTWPVSILGLLPSQVSVWLAVAGLWLAEAFSGFPIFRSWFVGN